MAGPHSGAWLRQRGTRLGSKFVERRQRHDPWIDAGSAAERQNGLWQPDVGRGHHAPLETCLVRQHQAWPGPVAFAASRQWPNGWRAPGVAHQRAGPWAADAAQQGALSRDWRRENWRQWGVAPRPQHRAAGAPWTGHWWNPTQQQVLTEIKHPFGPITARCMLARLAPQAGSLGPRSEHPNPSRPRDQRSRRWSQQNCPRAWRATPSSKFWRVQAGQQPVWGCQLASVWGTPSQLDHHLLS